jgi:hypothetical protein
VTSVLVLAVAVKPWLLGFDPCSGEVISPEEVVGLWLASSSCTEDSTSASQLSAVAVPAHTQATKSRV